MKTSGNILNKQLRELSDEELKQVNGGRNTTHGGFHEIFGYASQSGILKDCPGGKKDENGECTDYGLHVCDSIPKKDLL